MPIGTPIHNYVAYLLDENLLQVPVGVVGEICVGGAGVALGYNNNKEKTNEAFVESPLFPGSKLYRTGDYGRMRVDGQVEYPFFFILTYSCPSFPLHLPLFSSTL